jgi:hypothetical protein
MSKPKSLAVVLSTATIWCAGCATAGFDGAGVCPPLKQYSREEALRLAAEIERLDGAPMIVTALADYVVLRDQVRACRKIRRE